MTTDVSRAQRLAEWEQRSETPLLLAALVFLAVFITPLYRPDLPGPARFALRVANILVWAVFVADYLVRLRLSEDRRTFVRRQLFDLLVLAVPVLRPLRLLRAVGLFGTAARRAGRKAQGQTTVEVFAAVALLVVLAGGLVLDAERDAEGANISTPADALWWAMTTVTTVGYGDRFPVTGQGRVIGVLLMLVGIALLGAVSAGLATSFIKNFTAIEDLDDLEEAEDETARQLAEVNARLARLEALLQQSGTRHA